MNHSQPDIKDLASRIERLEQQLALLGMPSVEPKHYSVAEFAQKVGRARYTVREWARQGRIRAERRATGRGPYREFVISGPELARYLAHGLIPISQVDTSPETR